MSWIAAAVIAVSSVYSAVEAKSAQKKGRNQAKEDGASARKAEAFAETEGEGIRNLPKISLEVDDEVEDTSISKQSNSSSTVSI